MSEPKTIDIPITPTQAQILAQAELEFARAKQRYHEMLQLLILGQVTNGVHLGFEKDEQGQVVAIKVATNGDDG